jgi:hypothetical protein
MNENRTTWIVLGLVVVGIILAICTCLMCGMSVFLFAQDPLPLPPDLEPPEETWEFPTAQSPSIQPTAAPLTPAPPTVAARPAEAEETLAALNAALIPDADLHELGIRLLNVPPDTPRIARTESPEYEVGDTRRFTASNVDNDEQFELTAVLRYKTEHVYMWVEEGARIDEARLREAADLFEEHTYPTNREFFGSEWTPGVDSDPHLSILHARNLGNTVAGYYSSPDSHVQEVRPDSNEMEMFYINIDNVTIGDSFYNGVLAHEFQHMIHWANDRNEATWLNEGCSELAMALNDRAYGGHYDVGGSDYSYARQPDTQLNAWPEGTAGDASANYGGSYLFVEYFLDRFGEAATQDLVAHDENSMESVDAALRDLNTTLTHKELFADWTVANLLDEPRLDFYEGRYGYTAIDPATPDIETSYRRRDFPTEARATVRQYAVDYIEIESNRALNFTFEGATLTRLMDTEAHSGQYLWWSNREDESDTRLTRVIDLSTAQTAEVNFWAWHHIEEDWDYAYVLVGTPMNGGTLPNDIADFNAGDISWEILDDPALDCTTSNPNGNNFGCGLTGQSDGWVKLSADLTPYTGQEIALRFEYITDAAVNQSGLALDDIEIIVDGETLVADDVEQGEDGWQAEGFVRHANLLPQEWIVQLVTLGQTPEVQRLLLADGANGSWSIPLSNRTDHAVITISALAPVTTEAATYEYTLSPAD